MTDEHIEIVSGNTRAVVVPALGALVTSFKVGTRELLYFDDSTEGPAGTSRRGGVPVLFPSPGKLKNDLFEAEGRYGKLKNHGFARDMRFAVTQRDASQLRMRLEATDATLMAFPWDFALDILLRVSDRTLTYDVTIENHDDEAMPCAFGLHPYFAVADKSSARALTSASSFPAQAWDNTTKRTIDTPFPIDFTKGEVDLHFIGHEAEHFDLVTKNGSVRTSGTSQIRTWVLWTFPDKPFVCVEPWTSPGNALNTKADLLRLAAGEKRSLSIKLEAR